MKRRCLLFVAGWCLCCAALLCTGCSNNPYPPEPPGRKVLYGALHEDPRQGLDPVAIGDTVGASLVHQLYDCLYQYHYLKRPYEIEPSLAAGLPEFASGGLVVRIPIKQGIHFIDDPCFPKGQGREVVARDFVYALKRMADVNSGSHNYWLIQGKIKGLDALHKRSQAVAAQTLDTTPALFLQHIRELYDTPVAGLRAPERYLLEIELTEPFPQLRYILAMCNAACQAREAVEYYGCWPAIGKNDYPQHPVGTGPFMLHEWLEQRRLVFVRNPQYRREYYPTTGEPADRESGLLDDAGKRIPFVDQIRYSIIRESLPIWIYFKQGYLDLSGVPRDTFTEAINRNRELSAKFRERGIELIRSEEIAMFWKMFNMTDPVVGNGPRTATGAYTLPAAVRERNRKIRQAMSLAWDRERMIRVYLNGRGIPAVGPVPKGLFGYEAQPTSPYLKHDPAAARQLLADAGVPEGRLPDGSQLTITYDLQSSHPTLQKIAKSFVDDMQAIGIKIEIRTNTWAQYLQRTREGRFQLADSGWNMDYPDPENFLQLLYGPNRPPKSNNAAYWNPDYDALYEQMRDMRNTPERADLIQRMAAIVQKDCPWLFGYSSVSFILVPPWRENYKPHNISGGYAKYQELNVDLRNAKRAKWNAPNYWPLVALVVIIILAVAVLTRIRPEAPR